MLRKIEWILKIWKVLVTFAKHQGFVSFSGPKKKIFFDQKKKLIFPSLANYTKHNTLQCCMPLFALSSCRISLPP